MKQTIFGARELRCQEDRSANRFKLSMLITLRQVHARASAPWNHRTSLAILSRLVIFRAAAIRSAVWLLGAKNTGLQFSGNSGPGAFLRAQT